MRFKDNGKFNAVYGKTHVGANLIQGIPAYQGELFFSRNPANPADLVAVFPEASAADVVAASLAAHTALESWQNTSLSDREQIQANFALLLETQLETLASLLTRETGKVWALSKSQLLALPALAGQNLAGQDFVNSPEEPVTHLPGALALLSEGALPLPEILLALFSGHTLVWKVWDQAPAFAYAFASLLMQAGLPPGVLNLLNGGDIVETQLRSQIELGQLRLMSASNQGSTSRAKPQIVLADADLERAVTVALNALACFEQHNFALPVILQAPIAEDFKRRLLRQLQKVKIGDPHLDHKVQLGPLSHPRALNLFLAHLNWGKSDGGHLLAGKGRLSRESKPENFVGDPDAGYYVWPAIWDQLKPGMKLATNPVWGPSLGLFTVADHSAAAALGLALE
ncbi:MAG: aldehyde dehydrogenase family protein [Candidatus Sericytochromatia bacterium]|nr:aldehyde dehydrogenase family protein [Candidatus Sericytochromatia bacterium]